MRGPCQMIVAAVLGAVAGITTAVVLNYNLFIGLMVGAGVGFFGFAPKEALKITKSVFAEVLGGLLSLFSPRFWIKKIQGTKWPTGREVWVGASSALKKMSRKTWKLLVGLLMSLWVVFWFFLTPTIVTFITLYFVHRWGIWAEKPIENSIAFVVLCLVVGALSTLSIVSLNNEGWKYRSLSPIFPVMFLLRGELSTTGSSSAKKEDEPGEEPVEESFFRGGLFGAIVCFIATTWCLSFPLVLVGDAILTTLLALATTKRLTAMTGAVLGYLSGIAWHVSGGGLVGSYSCAMIVALLVCGCYLLRKPLAEGRWPFQQRQQSCES